MRIRNTDRNYVRIVQYKRDEYVNEDDGWHQDKENKIQPHRLSAFFNPKQKGFFFEKFCKSMLNNRLTVLAFIKTKNNSLIVKFFFNLPNQPTFHSEKMLVNISKRKRVLCWSIYKY